MKKLLVGSLAALSTMSAFAQPASPMANYSNESISEQMLSQVWAGMREGDTRDSICSNRAMVWSYEMKRDLNVDSKKRFIYYTNSYRHIVQNVGRHISWFEARFRSVSDRGTNWYYHVAPSVLVGEQEYVMDKKLFNTPVTDEQWVGKFERKVERVLNNPSKRNKIVSQIRSNIADFEGQRRLSRKERGQLETDKITLNLINQAMQEDGTYKINCKEIRDIAQHDFDSNAFCHVQHTSMYYWNPWDLRMLNYNTGKRIYEQNYTESLQRKASKNTYDYFTKYSVEQSFKQGYRVNFDLENSYKYEQRSEE